MSTVNRPASAPELQPALTPALAELRDAFVAPIRNVELRKSGNGEDYTFTGNAVVFNHWSDPLSTSMGSFRERILPGAFSDVLARNPDVRLLFNHDENIVLARTKSGTLDITETAEALRVWARLDPSDPDVQRLASKIRRGDVDQMSFMFGMDRADGAEDRWYEDEATGEVRRDVIKVGALYDVSAVTFPAYPDTTAALRSLAAARSAGLIQRAATAPAERRRYQRVCQLIAETPWAITPTALSTIIGIIRDRADGVRLSDEEIKARIGETRQKPEAPPGVALLGLYGPITPRASLFSEISGATSIQGFQTELREALADPHVSAIVIDVDSPGGTVDLVPELAAEIRAARAQKPVVAVANTIAASAAYWIASAASEFVVTPSGEVGSIGVFAAHQDISGMEEKLGVKTTLVSAGKFKTEGNPFEPLTDEAKAAIQKDVDAYYAMFVRDVAKNRGVPVATVREGFGQGRMVQAKEAIAEGMVDRVETIDQTIKRLTPRGRNPHPPEPPTTAPADLIDIPDGAFETRDALRAALGLAAQAATNPAGTHAGSRGLDSADGEQHRIAPAAPVGEETTAPSTAELEARAAQLEANRLAELKRHAHDAVREAKERHLQAMKELKR